MTQYMARYSGTVALGMTYRTPSGAEVIPVAFTMAGVKLSDGRTIRRTEFATYTKEEK
jgi:hypothetical protein